MMGSCWSEWEDEYRLRDELALEKFAKENREGICSRSLCSMNLQHSGVH